MGFEGKAEFWFGYPRLGNFGAWLGYPWPCGSHWLVFACSSKGLGSDGGGSCCGGGLWYSFGTVEVCRVLAMVRVSKLVMLMAMVLLP